MRIFVLPGYHYKEIKYFQVWTDHLRGSGSLYFIKMFPLPFTKKWTKIHSEI